MDKRTALFTLLISGLLSPLCLAGGASEWTQALVFEYRTSDGHSSFPVQWRVTNRSSRALYLANEPEFSSNNVGEGGEAMALIAPKETKIISKQVSTDDALLSKILKEAENEPTSAGSRSNRSRYGREEATMHNILADLHKLKTAHGLRCNVTGCTTL